MPEKQADLNGAFYGPSVPYKNSYHRPGRGRGCGGCCCLLTLLLEIIATVAVTLGIAALVFWLIFRPNLLKFHVTDAELTTFNLTTSTNTLNYDLKFNLTLRNPNKKIGVYYDRIEARAYFHDQRFDTTTFDRFYQGHKNTTVLSAVIQGQRVVLLDSEDLSDFNEDKAAGVYSVDLKLYLRVRFKIGSLKTFRMKPKINCDLNLPLSSSANNGFTATKCHFDW